MVRAVVDTNVFVSGTTGHSYPAQVIDAWRKERYVLITSPAIIEEISAVLRRAEIRKFTGLAEKDIREIIDTLMTKAFVSPGEVKVNVIKDDPDDDKFLASALKGIADYIVSGDKHLLSRRPPHAIFHQASLLMQLDKFNVR